ncbi:hypothetical protein FOZ62_022781 [Perkinsus olseni]|uniref:AMP-dependent synthetase/ligase domain-containing protein n=1 Tax=Perkinsus olseni TaxID=32597 RepID=A0A7J6QSG6_PEROL|nr:hypothetical protein FOZ62_022781 [Perkinsus olseni]
MGLCVSDAYPPGSAEDRASTWQFTDPVYSLPLLPPSDDASTSIYRNVLCKNSLVSVPMMAPELTTLPSLLEFARLMHGDRPFLGTRRGEDYWFMAYRDFYTQVSRLASGIQQLGICQKIPFDDEPYKMLFRIAGIYATGCINWVLTEFACHTAGVTVVPLHEEMSPAMISYIISDTRMALLFVTRTRLESALKCSGSAAHIKCIIVIDADNRRDIDPAFLAQAEAMEIMVLTLPYVIALGQGRPFSPYPSAPSDVALISYTGGSTGDPLGVMVTHRNCIATIGALTESREGGGGGPAVQLSSQDCIASMLPSTEPLDRTLTYLAMYTGSCKGFIDINSCQQKDRTTAVFQMVSEMATLQPTVIISEPAGLDCLITAILPKRKSEGRWPAWLRRPGRRSTSALERPSPSAVKANRAVLGGRLRLVITGGRPLPIKLHQTLKQTSVRCAVVNCLTIPECGGVALLASEADYRCGLAGGPIASLDMRLVDASDKCGIRDCSVAHVDAQTCELRPRGELCVRGNSVSPGYFRRPQATRLRFDSAGWFHTGDIVEVLPAGAVKLFDERICDQLDLGDGRMVSASRVEQAYEKHCSGIEQCVVFGSSKAETMIALVVPCVRAAKQWATEAEILFHVDELLESDWLRMRITKEMERLPLDVLPKGHKYRVNDVELVKEPFSVACGTITAAVGRRYRRSEIMLQNRDKIEAALRRLPLLAPPKSDYLNVAELITPRRTTGKYGDDIFTGSTALCSEFRRQSASTPETQSFGDDDPRLSV